MTAPFSLPQLEPHSLRGIPVLTDEALLDACGVCVLFTGRDGGASEGHYASLNCETHVGDDPRAVLRNRRLVCAAAGVPNAPLVVPRQVHGTDLVCIDDGGSDAVEAAASRAEEGADGLVVRTPGVAALLNFADCLPLVIVSPSGRFAVVHAGWRGAVAHIAAKAARELARGDGFAPTHYNAYIGAHIRRECFEVGEDVASRFRKEFGGAATAGARHVSLAAAVARDLVAAGLVRERIADAGLCTKCHPDIYYSHRASGGKCGRHAAFAVQLNRT